LTTTSSPSILSLNKQWFIGGYLPQQKDRLSKIYQSFPEKYDVYLEAFAGTATVALNQPLLDNETKPKIVAINDRRTLFQALIQTLTTDYGKFCHNLSHMIVSQDFHHELVKDFAALRHLAPCQYALYGSYIGHNTKTTLDNYKDQPLLHPLERIPTFNILELDKSVSRLQQMRVHNLDYKEFIDTYIDTNDQDSIMLYLDPPAPPFGWSIEQWAEEFGGMDKIFNWYEFFDYLKEVQKPNLQWLLHSYSPVTTKLFNAYNTKDMGSIDWGYTLVDGTLRPNEKDDAFEMSLFSVEYMLELLPPKQPIKILINKQDLVELTPLSPEEATIEYPIRDLVGRSINVLPTSAKYGDGVDTAIHWLFEKLT